MSDIFNSSVNSFGRGTGTGASKSKIEPDIYEGVIIALADAGKNEKVWQGQAKMVQQIVLAIQLEHVNGWGETSLVTDWQSVSGHENSNFTKNFLVPCKLANIGSIGELVGKPIRVEIEDNAEGYPRIARYFASKKPIEPVGAHLPKWLVEKGYPLRSHLAVLPGIRPIQPKVDAVAPMSTPASVPGFNAGGCVQTDADGDLPF